jgi:DNA-binding response OmpR family regulator
MKVLVIGDSRDVVEHIPLCLRLRWPSAILIFAATGSKGIELVKAEAPDLIMVDFSLPDMRCVELVSNIRSFSDVPLTVLVGEATEIDRAEVLEAGADDYIRKPLNASDVMAKTNALLRRARGDGFKPDQESFVGGNLEINFANRRVLVSGNPVNLSRIEHNLLCQLVRSKGRVLTHRTLLEKVWGAEYVNDTSLVKDHIHRLRKKLQSGGSHQQLIANQRGVGYRFIPPA